MLVAPSQEISGSYLAKSDSFLESARILREAEHLEEAVSMAYYSMYHAMTALLFRAGIRCENHAGAIMLLEELFGMDISALDEAKRMRVDTQYYV
ncbi:MAG: HEPN domain-containing protein, partial [Methanomicrobiales archaeon]|nr:HEPN domain-containing protein [Methanomicrobiales archaeon]